MRVELFPFQKRALADIRMKTAEAIGELSQNTCAAGGFLYCSNRSRKDHHYVRAD